MEKVTRRVVFENFIWRFLERCGAQIVSFIVSIVIARILEPEAYGVVALIAVFTNVLGVFVDSGLGNALIQKNDADDIDFSTVFYANIFFCTILYLGLFVCAPLIANFYEDASLIGLVRVSGLILLISGLKNIQQAYISKSMLFKKFFFATLAGTIISAIIGIWMAYSGMGAWALVVQKLVNSFIDMLILWITVKWRPKLLFSIKRLQGLFQYGWKLLASSILNTIYENIRQLVIGKLYNADALAFYNRGKQFPNLLITNVNSSMDSVLLPALASEQDDKMRVKSMTKRVISVNVYVIAPLLIGLAAVAEPLVKILLTDKWLPCVPYMRIFCITLMIYPIHTANLNAIKAVGRSDLFLKLEIIKTIMALVILLVAMPHGVMAIAYSMLLSGFLGQIINSWPNKELISYGYLEQVKDVLPSVMLSACMGVIVYFIGRIDMPSVLVIMIQVIAGALIYVIGSWIFKIEPFEYMIAIFNNMMKKQKVEE